MGEGPSWRQHLGDAQGAIHRLDRAAVKIAQSEAGEVAEMLRALSRQMWGIINILEAAHSEHLYNCDALIRDMARSKQFSVGEVWLELTETGALEVSTAKLLRVARKMGLDPGDYLELPNEEET